MKKIIFVSILFLLSISYITAFGDNCTFDSREKVYIGPCSDCRYPTWDMMRFESGNSLGKVLTHSYWVQNLCLSFGWQQRDLHKPLCFYAKQYRINTCDDGPWIIDGDGGATYVENIYTAAIIVDYGGNIATSWTNVNNADLTVYDGWYCSDSDLNGILF